MKNYTLNSVLISLTLFPANQAFSIAFHKVGIFHVHVKKGTEFRTSSLLEYSLIVQL